MVQLSGQYLLSTTSSRSGKAWTIFDGDWSLDSLSTITNGSGHFGVSLGSGIPSTKETGPRPAVNDVFFDFFFFFFIGVAQLGETSVSFGVDRSAMNVITFSTEEEIDAIKKALNLDMGIVAQSLCVKVPCVQLRALCSLL